MEGRKGRGMGCPERKLGKDYDPDHSQRRELAEKPFGEGMKTQMEEKRRGR